MGGNLTPPTHKSNTTMKKILFLYSLWLLSFFTCIAQDEIPCYTIKHDTIPIIVYFQPGCNEKIYLADIAGIETIYGDKYISEKSYTYVKGQYPHLPVQWDMAAMNNEDYNTAQKNKIYITLNDSLDEKEFFVYKKLNDRNKILFKFEKIQTQNQLQSVVYTDNVAITDTAGNNVETTTQQKTECEHNYYLYIYLWLGILSLLIIVIILSIWRNENKSKDDFNKHIKELNERIEHRKKEIERLSKSSNNLPPLANAKTLTEEEIRKIIQEEYHKLTKQPVKTAPQIVSPVSNNANIGNQSPQKPPFETTDVDCDWDSNFFELKKNDNPIFRIYQKGDTYYYTILEHAQSAMVQMMNGTSNFIKIVSQVSGPSSKIEVVKEGMVFRNGNKFTVDPNNMLQVKIV